MTIEIEWGDGKSKFYCEHEKRWRTYEELKKSEHNLKADNERLLAQCARLEEVLAEDMDDEWVSTDPGE